MRNYFTIFLVIFYTNIFGQSINENAISSYYFKEKYPFQNQINNNFSTAKTIYYDGIGNIKQIVYNNTTNDISSDIEYDGKFRLKKTYLSYPKPSNTLEYDPNSIYNSQNYFIENYADNVNYSEFFYEKTPFDQISETAAEGTLWSKSEGYNGHTKKFEYKLNVLSDSVKNFKLLNSWNNDKLLYDITLIASPIYRDGQLRKTIAKDENWSEFNSDRYKVIDFYDSEGRLYLQRRINNSKKIDTYYLYDAFGNLSIIIPPILSNKESITLPDIEKSGYIYYFDSKNRLAQKKTPNKSLESYVYDQGDRLILVQDESTKNKSWYFYKYDKLNRIVYEGLFKNTASRKDMQNALNSMRSENVENRSAQPFSLNGLDIYYTKKAFPTGSMDIHNVYYYDKYDNLNVNNFEIHGQHQPVNSLSDLKGQLVKEITKNLSDNSYTQTDFYYEKNQGEPIKIEKKYDPNRYTFIKRYLMFDGTLFKEEIKNKFDQSSEEVNLVKEYYYDNDNRLSQIKCTVNNQSFYIGKYEYNHFNQLTKKSIGGNDQNFSTSLSSMNYQYNIKGWLTSINNIDEENHLFSQEIGYFNAGKYPINLYNGTITNTSWKTLTDNNIRRYLYRYDDIYQLKSSSLFEYIFIGSSSISPTEEYLEDFNYDRYGNIISIIRNGENVNNQNIEIDNLVFQYSDQNLLLNVTDLSNNSLGFKDNTTTSTVDDYDYDINGNLIKDNNNGISIKYNHLNLPIELFNDSLKITYGYNANGHKITESFSLNNETKKNIVYLDGFKYINGDLKTIDHEEGYFELVNSIFYPTYQIKDHQGNNRIVFRDGFDNRTNSTNLNGVDGIINPYEILDEFNYYPSGLKHIGYNSYDTSSFINRSFADKESLDEVHYGFYDFSARIYNASIARWLSVDPLSDNFASWTPYHYVHNNPVNLVDPTGLAAFNAIDVDDDGWIKNKNTGNMLYHPSYTEDNTPAGYEYGDTFLDFAGGLLYNSNGSITNMSNGAEVPWRRSQRYEGMSYYHTKSNEEIWTYNPDAWNSKSAQHDDWQRRSSGAITPIGGAFDLTGIKEALITETVKATGNPYAGIALSIIANKGKASLSNAAKTVPSITEQAATLSQRLGKNSITLGTPTKQIRFDLVGKAHGNVPTPHMQIYNKNFVNGVQKSISRASKEAVPMTQQEIRIIRKYIETLGK